jgi:FixJ family two-component response regulator
LRAQTNRKPGRRPQLTVLIQRFVGEQHAFFGDAVDVRRSVYSSAAMHEAKALIAVVDDDPSVRKTLVRFIKAAGYSAVAYHCAEDLLESNAVNDSDCSILDVHLPGMSGLELQKDLKQMGHNCPVVFISAGANEDVRTQAIHNAAVEFLPKPLDNQRLLEVIAQALSARKTGRD